MYLESKIAKALQHSETLLMGNYNQSKVQKQKTDAILLSTNTVEKSKLLPTEILEAIVDEPKTKKKLRGN